MDEVVALQVVVVKVGITINCHHMVVVMAVLAVVVGVITILVMLIMDTHHMVEAMDTQLPPVVVSGEGGNVLILTRLCRRICVRKPSVRLVMDDIRSLSIV